MFAAFNTKTPEESSLLSEWTAYQRGDADVESTQAQASTSGSAFELAGQRVKAFFGGQPAPDGAVPEVTPAGEAGGIRGLWGRARESMAAYVPPTRDQITMFLGLLAGGALFLTMAFFFVFPPVIILSPQKFALSFTIGCALVMAAFAALRGLQNQVGHMFSSERLPFTAVYLGAMAGTLFFSLVRKNYIMCIIFSVGQVLALLYYLASYVPGGTQSVQWVLRMVGKGCFSCFRSASACQ